MRLLKFLSLLALAVICSMIFSTTASASREQIKNLVAYKFIWDSEKDEINYKKHKIKFEYAALVFFDEFKIDDFDEIHSDFEDIYKIIGRVKKILIVIYTERGDFTRIISARDAEKYEKEDYYGQFYY